jgi:hypothetical protein
MAQIVISVSFNPNTDSLLLDDLENKSASARVKEWGKFYLKYQHLIPEIEDASDLLSIVSQMAIEQRRLMEVVIGLNERINGLKAISIEPEPVVDSIGYNDMMEFE